jgi:PAS domain S-box-containing protein
LTSATNKADLYRRHLTRVVESSEDAIISKDLNSIIITWNQAAERMFGYTAEQAIGRSIRMIIPADRQHEEDEVLATIRAGRSVTHYETIRQHRDGSLFPIALTVSPILDDDGTIIGASKIARDISDQVRGSIAVRRLAAVVESSDDAIVTKDLNGVITSWNPAATRMFGYSESEAIGRSVRILIPDELQSEEDVVLAKIRAGERVDHYETVRQRKDGTRLNISLTVSPIRDGNGTIVGASKIARDITDRTRLAEENARLYEIARDANRMKDDFLAVLSHELRTPLNAIVGYSRLLRGGVLSPEKATRGLETLERNATWLSQIIEDVLDVSRIVSGKIRLDVQPVELPVIIDNAVATVHPAADSKQIKMQTVIDPRVAPVSGDPDRLQQVVWNLLSNAVKFTPRGGRIQVRLERVNSHVEITVSDTGAGISEEFLPYVFERFRQAEAGTTRKTGGLGLGLAIVRHIVEMHGGTVQAASAGPDKGATFRVKLPVMIVHPQPAEPRRHHPASERLAPLTELGDLSGLRIVAVDDDQDALMLLRVVLESAGAEVTTVGSPFDAVAAVERTKPHVVVLDIGMPDMDGFEVVSRIRASEDPLVRNVPAAALTAFARSEDRTKALRSGFEMHLAKPVDPGELVASVATLARRSRTLT